jgi:hypothetical protein
MLRNLGTAGALAVVASMLATTSAQADVPFTAIGSYPVTAGVINGAQTAHGDFNGDGKTDFVSMPGWGDAPGTVLLGNGDGTFKVLATPATSGFEVAVADLNGDGKPDS